MPLGEPRDSLVLAVPVVRFVNFSLQACALRAHLVDARALTLKLTLTRYVRSGYTSLTLQELFEKTVSVTVDLSAAKCGCAASFRLVPMVQNSEG